MKKYVIFLFCGLLILTGCRFKVGKKENLNFLSYNVQTFFDSNKDGNEYSEFTSSSSKWSAEKYEERLDRLASTILNSCDGGPDIALLIEVENQDVVYDLCSRFSSKYAYPYGVFIPWNNSPLMPALISRYPVKSVFVHQVYSTTFDSSLLRPLIEIHLEVDSRDLVVFCLHWKSKLAKNGEDKEMRKKQAELLASRVNEILVENPGAAVIADGDFNESWEDGNGLGIFDKSAEFPVNLTGNQDFEFLTLAGKESSGGTVLYEPWFDVPEGDRGSYYYNGKWECIDHILFTPGIMGSGAFEYRGFSSVRLPELFYKDGIPYRYEVYSGTGYSDHLPLLLTLSLAE